MATGFDTTELSKFAENMEKLGKKEMSKKFRKFINKESSKLNRQTKKEAKSAIEKRTGTYHSSIKRLKSRKKKGTYSSGTESKDNKAHLLEFGHEQVIGRGPRKGEKVGIVAGRNVFKAAADGFENEFNKDLGELVDEVAKELTK